MSVGSREHLFYRGARMVSGLGSGKKRGTDVLVRGGCELMGSGDISFWPVQSSDWGYLELIALLLL